MRSKEVDKAIKEVKDFNEKNRFRDGGVLNNSIDTLLSYIEELEEKWERDCHKINEIIRQEKELKQKILKQ